MPLLAPAFRELNFHRINQLSGADLSPSTIAGVINDETNHALRITAADVRSYLKIQAAASKQMLVSSKATRAIKQPPEEESPEPA